MRSSTQACTAALLLLPALCCAGPATAARAQLKRVSFPGGHCDLYLLAQEDVQRDLGLSDSQVRYVQDCVSGWIDEQRERTAQVKLRQLRNAEDAALARLSPEQVARLRQIDFQFRATASFWDPAVHERLKISDEQHRRIAAVPYDRQPSSNDTDELAVIRKDFLDYPKRDDEAWQMREWRRLAVLTATQRAKWKSLLGKPFGGRIPSPILVSVTREMKPGDGEPHSTQELTAEIRALRKTLTQIENRLSAIEKALQKPGRPEPDARPDRPSD